MTTLELLLMKYGPRLSVKELGEVMKMTPASIRTAISNETFPIETFRDGKNRMADVRTVAAHIDRISHAA